ncbi:MAG TPA: D-aminoacyl-tRNA deacylase [Bryobacteraceae bacterium]|nr:D-aminoacyl-tRNA deacylase [Bryobacteraceae bacterium]
MRALIQRVSEARVVVAAATVGEISGGLLIFLGVEHADREEDAGYLVRKMADLRIFPDSEGKMNRSVRESGGQLLVVSQFTLYGDCTKGRRPGFDRAARPEPARKLYEYFIHKARAAGLHVETGVFGATMAVHLVNDGPVTLICDSVRIAAE